MHAIYYFLLITPFFFIEVVIGVAMLAEYLEINFGMFNSYWLVVIWWIGAFSMCVIIDVDIVVNAIRAITSR